MGLTFSDVGKPLAQENFTDLVIGRAVPDDLKALYLANNGAQIPVTVTAGNASFEPNYGGISMTAP